MTRFNELIPCRDNSIDDFLKINKLQLIRIIGDGNCFFRTIAKHCYFEGIKRDEDGIMKHGYEFKENAQTKQKIGAIDIDEIFLRQKLFHYVKQFIIKAYEEPQKHGALMATLIVMNLDSNRIISILDKFGTSTTYDHPLFDLAIEYAADAFNMAIHIYSIDGNSIRAAHFMPCVADMPLTDVKMHYKNRNHYELLYLSEHTINYKNGEAFISKKYGKSTPVNEQHESIKNSNALKSTPGYVKCRVCNSTLKVISWKGHLNSAAHIKKKANIAVKNENIAESIAKNIVKNLNKSTKRPNNSKSLNKTIKNINKAVINRKKNIDTIINDYKGNKIERNIAIGLLQSMNVPQNTAIAHLNN